MHFEIIGGIIARSCGVRDCNHTMTTTHLKRYALCLKNKNTEDLVVRKLYPSRFAHFRSELQRLALEPRVERGREL